MGMWAHGPGAKKVRPLPQKKANRNKLRLFTTVRGFSRHPMSSFLGFGKVLLGRAGSAQPSGSQLGERLPTYAGTTFSEIS